MAEDRLGDRLRNASSPRGRRSDTGRPASRRAGRSTSSGTAARSTSRQATTRVQHRESNIKRSEFTYSRVEPKPARHEEGKIDQAKDTLAELFSFDVPMRGEKFDLKKLLREHKKPVMITFGSLAGVALLLGAFALIFRLQSSNVAKESADTPTSKQVGFNPLVPLGKESKTGADVDESDFFIDKEKKVLGYNSQYSGVGITVSQQKLPGDIRQNPSEGLQKVANSFGANEAIETLQGTAYIKIEENGGKQLVVFATDENLVFIQTDKELLEDDLEFYINQLSPKY